MNNLIRSLLLVIAITAFHAQAMEKIAHEQSADFTTLKEACESMAPILDKAALGDHEVAKKLKRALVVKLIPHCMIDSGTNLFSHETTILWDHVEKVTKNLVSHALKNKKLSPPQTLNHAVVPHTSLSAAQSKATQEDSMSAGVRQTASMKKNDAMPAQPAVSAEECASQQLKKDLTIMKHKIKDRLGKMHRLNFKNKNDLVILQSFAKQEERFKTLVLGFIQLGYKTKQALTIPFFKMLMMNTQCVAEMNRLVEKSIDLDLLARINFELRELLGIPSSVIKQQK